VGQQPTGGTYASGYIAPWKSSVQLTQDWNSNYSHNGSSAYAKDWVIADHKVYAAKAGKVVYVKQDSTRYGDSSAYANDANYVIISHDDGYESLYLHLKAGSVPVKVGDVVQAGTYLGETGLSGWTTGEHLHFVVRNPSTKQSVPFKLDGNTNAPNPQQPPTSSGVWPTSFSAWVMATDGANVRSGPGTAYQKVGYFPYKTTLEFDAWTYGETITDVLSGKPDARWYRIKGTEKWVSSAIVYGNAPGSTPLPSNNPGTPTPPGYTVNANFNSVWQQYKNTLGNPTSGVINHSSGATYQLFQNGSIVSSKYGTFPLYGGIRQTYLSNGGLDGWLGAPKSAEYSQGNGVIRQDFENGYIIWNGSKATAYKTGTGTPVAPPPNPTPGKGGIEYGSYKPNVSKEFLNKVSEISQRLGVPAEYLMAVMGFETGGTYSPSAKNSVSGATGLIQFIPSTAAGLGTSTAALAQMSAIQQLDYVEKYLSSYKGRLKSLSDVYMAVLWPAAVGKSSDQALWSKGSNEYTQNSGLDIDKNGVVTVGEATSKARQYLPAPGLFA